MSASDRRAKVKEALADTLAIPVVDIPGRTIAQLDALYANWFLELIDNLENHYAYYLNQNIGKKRAKFAEELRAAVGEGFQKDKEGK